MSIEFAEKIIDGMVDENGHCGDRAMSVKQFEAIVYGCSTMCPGKERDAGGWEGDYSFRDFWERDWEGTVGKYNVKLNEFHHFHGRYTVVNIDLRPKEELEFEAKMRELAKFENSEWVGEPKKRMDMELTLVRDYQYERQAYGYSYGYHPETAHIYTLADADGNCYVWKTSNPLKVERWDEDGWLVEETYAELGDKVTMRATVKEHNEYKGTKQTVINRPKVSGIEKAA